MATVPGVLMSALMRRPKPWDASIKRFKTLTHPALLVDDEIGYLPVIRSGPILFFQLVNPR